MQTQFSMRLLSNRLCVLFFLVGGFIQISFGQNSIDEKLIETSLLKQVNKVRDTTNLVPLDFDEHLFNAANHHVRYCENNSLIKHEESSSKYQTVKKRVAKYGSKHGVVSEVVTKIAVNHLSSKDYDTLAFEILKRAFKSPKNKSKFYNRGMRYLGISVKENERYLYVVFVFGSPVLFSDDYETPQKLYGITGVTNQKEKLICETCRKKFKKLPLEVTYDVYEQNGEINFVMSDEKWFRFLFSNKKDGISVDIVRKSQFPCGLPNVLSTSPLYKGYVLPPVYAKDFSDNGFVTDNNEVVIPLGNIPEEWKDEPLELNLMVIQDGILCRYNTYFRVPFDPWGILDLEFDYGISNSDGELVNVSEKEMSFQVPFEKGKYTFDSLDLKPLADSLRLTDFTITGINIKAYSSVEGSERINLKLQKDRAESIVKALQSYDQSEIDINIETEENWVEFFRDIQGTKFAFLVNKQKEDIRKYLNNKNSSETESLLKGHRKATIEINLRRRDVITNLTEQIIDQQVAKTSGPNDLEKYYLINKVLLQKVDTTRKLELLTYLYEKVKGDSLWSAEAKVNICLRRLALNSGLLDEVFEEVGKYWTSNREIASVLYNYSLLEINKWNSQGISAPPKRLLDKLLSLNQIPQSKKNRLLINYHILNVAYLYEAKNFGEKNESIREIVRLVAKTKLTDRESFIIARFYADYQKYKEAIRLVEPFLSDIEVDEDLLFLYINLTIIENNIVKQPEYRTALTNASLSNKVRFCKLFNSSAEGGITFQLLENKFLKRTYCEQCE